MGMEEGRTWMDDGRERRREEERNRWKERDLRREEESEG